MTNIDSSRCVFTTSMYNQTKYRFNLFHIHALKEYLHTLWIYKRTSVKYAWTYVINQVGFGPLAIIISVLNQNTYKL